MKSVYIRVPGSSGNLGPGFDVLAAALKIYQELEVRLTSGSGIEVRMEGESDDRLSTYTQNLICQILLNKLKGKLRGRGLSLWIRNGIPISRGLGASAAARLAALAAAEIISGKSSKGAALAETIRLEGHPDNAAASFYGGVASSGFTNHHLWVRTWTMPADLKAIVVIPQMKLSTEKARKVLPRQIPRNHAVENLSRLAGLLWALSHRRYEGLREFMGDAFHQPYRQRLLPGMKQVIFEANRAGALGAALSGAGSSILAIAKNTQDMEKIGRAMQKAFSQHRMHSQYKILSFENKGLHIETA
ncbi:MAG: homoserine kinase [Elusimicrobia bacterium]|nr:homoserine kinase [Elusimicrobiota bacterium]